MKKTKMLATICLTAGFSLAAQAAFAQDLMITGVFDGGLSGGLPKGIQLKAVNDIPDLSIYEVDVRFNGDIGNGSTFALPSNSVPAGTYFYVTKDAESFATFFGFPPTYESNEVSINGDDPILILENGSVIDTFGIADLDGTGEPWEYKDSWASRKPEIMGPGAFELGEWTFGGVDALDGAADNVTATTPVPNIPANQGPSPKALGEACGDATECGSGNCIDGVCCDTACGDGEALDCLSCLGAQTGGADGTCGALAVDSSCGDAPGECFEAGTCDAQGTCVMAPKAAGEACGDASTSACDAADTCDGAGVCQTNRAAVGTACGDEATECSAQDVCNADGVCEAGDLENGTACGSEATACSAQDTCMDGVCQANDLPDGSNCGDAASECSAQDTCLAGVCQVNDLDAGVACGNAEATECNAADTCDGAGACIQNLAAPGTACVGVVSECTQAGQCSDAGVCVNLPKPAGTACGDPTATECNGADACDGAGMCQPSWAAPGTMCGSGPTECSDQDTCNGQGFCMPNDKMMDTPCGSADANACDAPDSCNGSGTCMPNFVDAGTNCGEAATECSAQDTCDGSGACQPNHLPAQSACGDAEATECNGADSCDGAGVCQSNVAQDGTSCGDAASDCSEQDTCMGGLCQVNDKPAGAACGDPTDNACNGADTCNGSGSCEANLAMAGSACGDPTSDECNRPDSCDAAGNCINNVVEEGTPCGDEGDSACDRADTCDDAGSCQANVLTPEDDCDDQVACTVGQCDADQGCVIDDSGCERICKDAVFWAAYPETSEALLGQLEPVEVCGTRVANLECALEGLCIPGEIDEKSRLKRELLTAALNCKAYNGQINCERAPLQEVFESCSQVCNGNDENAMIACIRELECVNLGGEWSKPFGRPGGCVVADGEGDGGCFQVPVEANGMLSAIADTPNEAQCDAARATPEGLSEAAACQQLPAGEPNNDGDLDGINDTQDLCPGTVRGATVDKDGCDVLHYCPCDSDWGRGEFMQCVSGRLDELQAQGRVNRTKRRLLRGEHSRSDCGLRLRSERDRVRRQLERVPNLPDWLIELLFG